MNVMPAKAGIQKQPLDTGSLSGMTRTGVISMPWW